MPATSVRSTARLLRAALLSLTVVALATGVVPPPAHAQSDADVERARTLFTQGLAAYEAGRLDEAVRHLREADRLVHSTELTFNIARVYERMGEVREAIQHYQRWLREATPDDAQRADVDARIAALRELERRQREQVMTMPPSSDELTQEARTFFERGVAMFRRRRYDAALQAFTAAYRFAALPEVIYNLAVASERTEHVQDAIDYYREYLRARPDGPDRAIVERHIEELRAGLRR